MEYVICRAMEIGRLESEEMIKLQAKERNIERCLLPCEIQEIFGLPTLKERYQIPEHEVAQGQHVQKIRGMMRKEGLIPKKEDFAIRDVEAIHKQDGRVRQMIDDLRIDFTFQGEKRKRRLVDDMPD